MKMKKTIQGIFIVLFGALTFLPGFSQTNVTLSVKVFLQGACTSDKMTTNLAGILPAVYESGGSGSKKMNPNYSVPNEAVDVIDIYLRDPSDLSVVKDSSTAWLLSDGTIKNFSTAALKFVIFNQVSSGYYYVEIRHRNHLPIMSASPIMLTTAMTVIDFTQINNIYQKAAIVVFGTSTCAMIAGNVVKDGTKVINASDLYEVSKKVAAGPFGFVYSDCDVNMDSNINATDYDIVSDHNDKLLFSPIP